MSSVPIEIFRFIASIIPEILALFKKHNGEVEPARRDMRSLLSEIKDDESAIDAELDRQREAENG